MSGLLRVLLFATALIVGYSILVHWLLPGLLQLALAIIRFLHALFYAIILMVATGIVVRWILPTLLQLALKIVGGCVAVATACFILPEYWLSTVARRRLGSPPRIAYEYDDVVAGLCRFLHLTLHRFVKDLTVVVTQKVASPLIAVLTGGVYLFWQLR
jgi:hypothetical protein